MAHYLADTSLIIDLINDQSGRREFIKRLLQPEEDLHCCTINVIEVFAGMRKGEEKLTAHWFDQFSYHDVTRIRLGELLNPHFKGKPFGCGLRM